MIEMAGGDYVFADLTDNGNNLATVNLSLENFYAGAKDADVLIYNSTIEGEVDSLAALLENAPCWRTAGLCSRAMSGVRRRAFFSRAWSCRI